MATEDSKSGEKKRQSVGKLRIVDNILPMARIKKIILMDPGVPNNISHEATYLICSATEHFVRWLAKEAYSQDTKALSYQSLAKYVQDEEQLDFLHQIIPNKMTVREYKKILKEDKAVEFDSASDATSSSESGESGESDDSEKED